MHKILKAYRILCIPKGRMYSYFSFTGWVSAADAGCPLGISDSPNIDPSSLFF